MRTRYFVLVMGIVLVACTAAAEAPPTALPEPTIPPEPTATPTELVATEIPPSPSPSPTDTPPATPTQVPTETPLPIQFNFTWYENNPILQKETSIACNYYCIWDSKVVLIDGEFLMFYTFATEDSTSIGYAVSTNGFTFTKHDTNPIFQPDGKDLTRLELATRHLWWREIPGSCTTMQLQPAKKIGMILEVG